MMGGGVTGGMSGSGGMGGTSGMGGGMFNVAPEKVGQIKVATVCLEHGKAEPRPAMKYEIKPVDEVIDKPAVQELCRMLGRGDLNQRAAQAAAWHLNNNMSWDELAKKQYKYASGLTKPYFTAGEIRAAMSMATVAALAAEQPKAGAESGSASQNRASY